MAPDLLSTIRREIDERLSELRPRLAEYEQLLVAADALLATGGETVAEAVSDAVPDLPEQLAPEKPKRARAARARKVALPAVPEATVQGEIEPVETKPARAARGAAREAILAALDHGSHTVGELVVVTAMSGPNINGNLHRLATEGMVVKTEREGKTAWAQAGATT
jgi:DNA-binding transcriptional ArsR family regulator